MAGGSQPYLANPKLTAPDFDFADFSKPSLEAATQPDGVLDTIPLETDFWLIYYNKQLFAKKNVEVPQTFDEMLAAARTLTDKPSQTYGFVARGLRNANVPVWTNFLLGQDQETVTPDGKKLLTDTPDAIAAAQMYRPSCAIAPRRASSVSTGTSARPASCRARSRCGWTASASRRRWSIHQVQDRRPCRLRGDAGRPEGA